MFTLNKEKVLDAMRDSGFDEKVIDQVTRVGFYKDIMSSKDPDSKDIYTLYGILGIKEDTKPKPKRKEEVPKKEKKVEVMDEVPKIKHVSKHMVPVNQEHITNLIAKEGWGMTEFCEYAGLGTASNFNSMLKRGTIKFDVLCALSCVLRKNISDIVSKDVADGLNAEDCIQKMPERFRTKSLEYTSEVSSDKMKECLQKYGLSYNALANDIHIPDGMIKQILSSGGSMPRSTVKTLKELTGVRNMSEKTQRAKPSVLTNPDVVPSLGSGAAAIYSIRNKPKTAVAKADKGDNFSKAMESIANATPAPEPKVSPIKEEKKSEMDSIAQAIHADFEQRELQEYLDEQHRQEQSIRTNKAVLKDRRELMEHDGMISIDALIMIANLLDTNPEVKDLLLILSQLHESKRTQIVDAMKALITALQ